MNLSPLELDALGDIQRIRQTTYSYIHNESILFDQREAEIRQQLEQEYQRGLEERRKEQDSNYQQTFQHLRSKFDDSPAKAELNQVIEDIERKVHMGLHGERCKDTEVAQQQQNVFDQKRLQMAQAREEQIPHDIEPIVKAMEVDPSKFEESLTWDEHLAYFNAKWKAEGYTVLEPYSISVGTPPIMLQVPGGQVAHAVNGPSPDSAERIPELTREGFLQESQLAMLICNNPEYMDKVLLSNQNFGEAESFARDLRQIWQTQKPDKARDSILMLCTATVEFHHDFEELTLGLSKDESVQKLNETLVNAFPEKKQVAVIEPPKAIESKAAPLAKPSPNPTKRISALDEVEQENSKPFKKFKEKTLDF